jgi:hypothetical protein
MPQRSLDWYAEMARDWQELADDLADALASVVVEYEPNEASQVLARYRKAERL